VGLDAHVRCACFKEGRVKPCPFPSRLRSDEFGQPYLDETGLSMDQLIEFDRWNDDWGCEHHGYLVETRIGNIAYVAHIRATLQEVSETRHLEFPILRDQVVYSGTHAGDFIDPAAAKSLLGELEIFAQSANDGLTKEFIDNMRHLAEASITTGNPIVF
jgi:hypothetical protein